MKRLMVLLALTFFSSLLLKAHAFDVEKTCTFERANTGKLSRSDLVEFLIWKDLVNVGHDLPSPVSSLDPDEGRANFLRIQYQMAKCVQDAVEREGLDIEKFKAQLKASMEKMKLVGSGRKSREKCMNLDEDESRYRCLITAYDPGLEHELMAQILDSLDARTRLTSDSLASVLTDELQSRKKALEVYSKRADSHKGRPPQRDFSQPFETATK